MRVIRLTSLNSTPTSVQVYWQIWELTGQEGFAFWHPCDFESWSLRPSSKYQIHPYLSLHSDLRESPHKRLNTQSLLTSIDAISKAALISLDYKNLILMYSQGFRPEWCISTMIYSRDTLFWSETLDIQLELLEHNIKFHPDQLRRVWEINPKGFCFPLTMWPSSKVKAIKSGIKW